MNDIRTVATVYIGSVIFILLCFYAIAKPAPVQGVGAGSDWRSIVVSVVN